MHALDILIFLTYFVVVAGYGYYIHRKKKATSVSTQDFFLAKGSLTWWAIGSSIIAANISAEQFIGMSGSGFAIGLGIASYEWISALGLIIVAVFFLPIYLKNKIFTMPQFLRVRYDQRVATVMAIFWLLVYVCVNLTAVLYLGALAISAISGFSFILCIVGLGIFGICITLGGMKVIGYTDVIQVFFLIIGGLAATYLSLELVAQSNGDTSWFVGLETLFKEVPSHFHMIIEPGDIIKPDGQDAYMDLPGLSVLIGGMWIMNLSYWGCNQYIIQRALGASLPTAQKGLLFAGFLKLIMPIIVVLPGIAAFYLFQKGGADNSFSTGMLDAAGLVKPDKAYPLIMSLLPVGLKGLSFAAITAAIVASLASQANSTATIFTLDIYKNFINKNASEEKLVKLGKLTIIVAMVIAMAIAPNLINLDQGFQFIQEFTGFITPGVLAIFLLGMFWKRATSTAALTAAVSTFALSILFKNWWLDDMPFMNRMMVVFGIVVVLMVIVSFCGKKPSEQKIVVEKSMFTATRGFTIGASIALGIMTALYLVFW